MTAGALEQMMTMTTMTTMTTMIAQRVTAMLAGVALDLQMMAERERAARRFTR